MADAKNAGTGAVEQPRSQEYQPYDACSEAPLGPWVKIQADVPGGSEAQWQTDFPSSPPWMQT